MPELDSDLFQWLTLVLLGLTVLVLLLALLSLGRIRRALERNASLAESIAESSARREQASARTEPQGDFGPGPEDSVHRQGGPGREGPAGQHPAELQTAEPQPRAAASAIAPEGARDRSEDPLDTGAYLRAQSRPEAAFPREPTATESYEQPHGASETREHPAVAQHREPPAHSRQQTPPRQEEPQEQPFERDGRWWFRRDDELLLYDERTGQWGPAPVQDPSETVVSAAVRPPAGGTAGPTRGAEEDRDVTTAVGVQGSQPQESGAEEHGSFWKCASCGAVNDATASSCRICSSPKGFA
jgi:hypothetical protein